LNQNPEQIARDEIDKQLLACGWVIQNKNQINLNAGLGVAVREYQTSEGPADYVLFIDEANTSEENSGSSSADRVALRTRSINQINGGFARIPDN